jgi:hypothetical protein
MDEWGEGTGIGAELERFQTQQALMATDHGDVWRGGEGDGVSI